jgi:large subunit ribosomal protein L17
MLRNLATSLLRHGRVRTTEAKAKELIPFVERLITRAKDPTLHNRRYILSYIKDKEVVKDLFGKISPSLKERPGGHLRAMKNGRRRGDGATMSVVEIIR